MTLNRVLIALLLAISIITLQPQHALSQSGTSTTTLNQQISYVWTHSAAPNSRVNDAFHFDVLVNQTLSGTIIADQPRMIVFVLSDQEYQAWEKQTHCDPAASGIGIEWRAGQSTAPIQQANMNWTASVAGKYWIVVETISSSNVIISVNLSKAESLYSYSNPGHEFSLGDLRTCKNEEQFAPYDCIEPSSAFSADDSMIVAWIKFNGVTSLHKITWVWIEPSGGTYTYFESNFGDNGPGWYVQASYVDITTLISRVNHPYGNWTVNIYVDRAYLTDLNFTILAHPPESTAVTKFLTGSTVSPETAMSAVPMMVFIPVVAILIVALCGLIILFILRTKKTK